MSISDQETVWLAALLHDLGKFWQRSFGRRTKPHEEYGRLFVEEEFRGYFYPCGDDLAHAIANHHARPPFKRDIEKQVVLADRLSANERVKEDRAQEEPSAAPLVSLFSRPPIAPDTDSELKYKLEVLNWRDKGQFFPRRQVEVSPAAYAVLWEQFCSEFRRFTGNRGHRSADFTSILALLRKYTSRMPSATPWEETEQSVPDISLYDHLKTTTALAACIARECYSDQLDQLLTATARSRTDDLSLQERICALVKGDISGTQDFLYLLTSKGAARGLRGRSFYVQLLTETIARWILRQFELPDANLLFAGGGHFYLLLPLRETREKIDDLRQCIAAKLWNAHKGDLSLTVDFVAVTVEHFLETERGEKMFAKKWDEVSGQVNKQKQRKWRDLSESEFFQCLFQRQEVGGTQEICEVCKNEGELDPDYEIRKCRRCSSFEKLGRELRNPKHSVVFAVEEQEVPADATWDEVLKAFGADVRITDDLPRNVPEGARSAVVYRLDEPSDFLIAPPNSWGNLPVSFDFRCLADATPRIGEDEIADFSDLASASEGVKWMGVLRMDVDDLGKLFRERLGALGTISRVSTLSESLRLFFEGWVPQVCRQRNPNPAAADKIYLIYAGGDDLFVVGAWSELPKLAQEIRSDLREFVGGNHITLSAGIAIEHQKFPLYQLAQDAKCALDDQAKELKLATRSMESDRRSEKKDALAFLQTAMGWEQFQQIADWHNRLLEMLEPPDGKQAIARAFLMRLSEIHELYKGNKARWSRMRRKGEIQADNELRELIHYGKWQWRLVYQLGRFCKRYPHFESDIRKLQKEIAREQDGLIALLHVLARWTALLTREE